MQSAEISALKADLEKYKGFKLQAVTDDTLQRKNLKLQNHYLNQLAQASSELKSQKILSRQIEKDNSFLRSQLKKMTVEGSNLIGELTKKIKKQKEIIRLKDTAFQNLGLSYISSAEKREASGVFDEVLRVSSEERSPLRKEKPEFLWKTDRSRPSPAESCAF